VNVEQISAMTLKVANMQASIQFYRDLLGMEVVYGGEDWCFSSLRAKSTKDPILNLEQGSPVPQWGRLIFLCTGSRCVLELSEGKRISCGEPSRRLVGRTVFSHVRSGRSRAVVCTSALMSFRDQNTRP
jgi:glyoxalase/bleomycin resistance protein/dioxygenase superfamily protein